MQKFTFSSASTNLANYQPIEINYSPSVRGGSQFIRFFGRSTGTGAGDTATIEMALVRDGERVAYFEGTVTSVAQQEGSEYLCTVSFAESSSSKFDLLGCDSYGIDQVAALGAPGGKAVWYIGVRSFTGMTALTLYSANSGVA